MTDSPSTGRLLFVRTFAKPVMLEFDQRRGSSVDGAQLRKAGERRYGLIAGRRHRDGPCQWQPVLGQPVPRAAECGCLCAVEGTTPRRWGHQLRPSASQDSAGALPETGCSGDCLSKACGRALAAIVLASGYLPAHGVGIGCIAWVERHRCIERDSDSKKDNHSKAILCPESAAAPTAKDNQSRRNRRQGQITQPAPFSATFYRPKCASLCVREY